MFNFFKRKERAIVGKRRLSKEYIQFLLEEQATKEPRNWYERLCKFAETLRLRPPKSLEEKLRRDIVFSTLHVTPTGVFSASVLSLILVGMLAFLLSLFTTDTTVMLMLFALPFGTFYYVYTYPAFQAQVLRVQAGDEAIKIILYMVIYLKLNPSFEGAVSFAAAHAKGPISEDIKKALWDLQVGKHKTIEEALAAYMPKWAVWNEDFVRAISLLYGVLIEPSEEGRDRILRKALSFLLDSTHQKMKSYVEEIASPITILHIMGLMLPVMGLIMFPMLSLFLHQQVSIPLLMFGYIVILPLMNLFFIVRILMKRPSAFVVPEVSKHPELPPPGAFAIRFDKKRLLLPITPIAILVGLLIMLPGIFHFIDLAFNIAATPPGSPLRENVLMAEAEMNLKNLVSTFSITAGFGVAAYLYFFLQSYQRIRIRNEIKNIEKEFQVGLFSLGNFLSEGYPIEVSVEKSLDEYNKLGMQKRPVYKFFSRLLHNIRDLGMTFRRALFDREHGIIRLYPSVLIEEVMRILSDASQKSSVLLGRVAKTIAGYLEDLAKIEAKIRELLEDTRAGIRLQASFIVPMICAVVASLGIFLINMLKILGDKLAELEKSIGLGFLAGGTSGFSDLLGMLVGDFTKVVPMTVLQAIVGIYTVEVVVLLSYLLSGIENGFDKTASNYTIAQNLAKAIVIYGVVSFITLIVFRGLKLAIEVA